MIIDEVTIFAKAGDGGDGKVSFRRAKFIPKGGPDGGNGGKGGDVYIQVVSDLSALKQFQHKKEIVAENGEPGRSKKQSGKDSPDLTVRLPVGTIITPVGTPGHRELEKVGERILWLKGGHGGRGNDHFKSSTNQTPMEFEKGTPGQQGTYILNLQYIADIGLIGEPNAGKSSLLNVLTNAEVQTANYPFTTLEPNLGVMKDDNGRYPTAIIADIPGLIEGAHEGKGLGHRFLKHIKKTRILLHCIDSTEDDIEKKYKAIRTELEKFGEGLDEKEEFIVLTKIDEIDKRQLNKKIKIAQKLRKVVVPVSILDDASITLLITTIGCALEDTLA